MDEIKVVGGGIAGLVAAITAAEQGASVRLFEAHSELGGRARDAGPPYHANLGPHVLYKGGSVWSWLAERELLPSSSGLPLAPVRLRYQGELRRRPPMGALPAALRLRGRQAPADAAFRDWVGGYCDPETAELLSMAAGVYTFHHDPGELSAAFVWERMVRTLLSKPTVRYVHGGWNVLVAAFERYARRVGVQIETGVPVEQLPSGPVVVATELPDARRLLEADSLSWPSGRTVCIDLAVEHRRSDPFVVSDLDQAGWAERFSAADSTLAPEGQELIQAQMPLRPGEEVDGAAARLDALLALAYHDLDTRTVWRRRQFMDGRSGALDHPGRTWRDRPAVDRGDGVFLAGDCVAAPGLLSEVALSSGVQAGEAAAAAARAAAAGLRRVA